MSDYRRARVPGATYFFTVNLRDRSSDLLVREIDLLRATVRATKARHPFHIDAWVVLPEQVAWISRWKMLRSFPPYEYGFQKLEGMWRSGVGWTTLCLSTIVCPTLKSLKDELQCPTTAGPAFLALLTFSP